MDFSKSEHLILSPSSDRHSDHKPVVSPLSTFSVLICEMGELDLIVTKTLSFLIIYNQSLNPEKAMAPHSSTLAWEIPWTEEPGRLQSMGSLRVRYD